jgi:hypothetical protein
MTDSLSNAIRAPKQLAKTFRNWARAKEWERKYMLRRLPFSSRIGDEIAEQLKARGAKHSFGTFVYGETNVGDDVQTIAQLGYLPLNQDLVAYNRDEVSTYAGDRRIFIMNGWFGNFPWPPSPQIDPIFISFHMAGKDLARPEYADYYRQHQPIGCRDRATVEKLEKIGVEAYFSGCLTLTLRNPYGPEDRGDYAVVVDAHLENDGAYPPSTPALLKRLVPQPILKNAIYVEQEVSDRYAFNFAHKTARALELLDLYAKAKVVITTRLHCALPCLALGTPVVFMHRNYESDIRFDGYREFLKGYSLDATSADIDWDAPRPMDISQLRNRVIADLRGRLLAKLELPDVS